MADKAIAINTKKLLEKTPKEYIRTRMGRGGKRLSYVETGYIINKLNAVFNYLWSFEILEERIGETQIYVRGRLTAYVAPQITITKVQYGGKEIAKNSSTGQPIDIGDDLKAASSDALKKCASLFGISQDVFWPAGIEYHDETDTTETKSETPEPPKVSTITHGQKTQIIQLLSEKGKTMLDLDEAVSVFGVKSYQDLQEDEAEKLIIRLTSLPNK